MSEKLNRKQSPLQTSSAWYILYFIVITIRAFYCLRSSVSLFSCWNVFPHLLFCICRRVFEIIYIFFFCITLRNFDCNHFHAISYPSRVYKQYFIDTYTMKCSARCWLRCFVIIKENADNLHWSEVFIIRI